MEENTVSIALGKKEPTVTVPLGNPPELDSAKKTEGIASNLYVTNKLSNTENIEPQSYFSMMKAGDSEGARKAWLGLTTQARAEIIQGRLTPQNTTQSVEEARVSQDNFNQGHVNREAVSSYRNADQLSEPARIEQEMLGIVRERKAFYENRQEGVMTMLGHDVFPTLVPGAANVALNRTLEAAGYGSGSTLGDFQSFFDVAFNTDTINKVRNLMKSMPPRERLGFLKNFVSAMDRVVASDFIKEELLDQITADGFSSGWNTVWDTVDVVGVLPIGKAVSLLRPVTKAASAISTAKALKDSKALEEVIEEAVDQAVGGINYSKITGTTTAEIADTLLPGYDGDTLHYLTGRAEDVSLNQLERAQLKELLEVAERQQQLADETLNNVNRAGLFNSKEDIAEAAIARMKIIEKDYKETYDNVSDFKVLSVDDFGFEFQYKVATSAKRSETLTETMKFEKSDLVPLKVPLEHYKRRWLKISRQDPNARMEGKVNDAFVGVVERTDNAVSFITDGIKKVLKAAYPKGFNDTDHAVLDAVLTEGSRSRRVFELEELKAGVDVGGDVIQLTDRQIKAYYGIRYAVDIYGAIQKKVIIENMQFRGISWFKGKSQQMGVKMHTSPEDAKSAFASSGGKGSSHISVDGVGLKDLKGKDGIIPNGGPEEMTDAIWQKVYDEGYVLVKTDANSRLFQMKKGSGKTQWALVKREKVVDPEGQDVLNIIPGYTPVQRVDSFFFIKKKVDVGLSGNPDFQQLKTFAWADNKKDAEEWIKNHGGKEAGYDIIPDRELPPETRGAEIFSAQGGTFTGARSSDPIEYAGDNSKRGKMISPLEGFQNYTNHLGRKVGINLVREGMEYRTIQEAQRMFGVDGVPDKSIKSMEEVFRRAHTPGLDVKKKGLLLDMYNQSRYISNIPTDDEIKFSGQLHAAGLWFEETLSGKVPGAALMARGLYGLSNRGVQVPDAMKSLSFNMQLGLWNASQWFVQTSGFIVTASISPKSFALAMPKVVGFTIMDQLRKGTKLTDEVMAWHKKNKLVSYVDEQEYLLWSRSGHLEAVANNAGDFTGKYGKERPFDANKVRNLLGTSTSIYRAGELNNTRIAFATAIEDWKVKFPDKVMDGNSDEILEWVRQRAEVYRLHMSKGNQSDWNKGYLGVMLQYKQVTSKYFNAILPQWAGGTKELSYREKLQLASIPTLVTGMSGVPVLEDVVIGMANLFNIDLNEAPPEVHTALKWGANQFFITHILGIDADVSSRSQLGTNYYDSTMRVMDEPLSVWKLLLGPSGTALSKIAKEGEFLAKALQNNYNTEIPTGLKAQAAISIVLDSAAEFFKTATAFKQYKNHMFNNETKLYRKGKYIRDIKDANWGTDASRLAGFNSLIEADSFDFKRDLKQMNEQSIGGSSKFLDTNAAIALRIINVGILGATSDEQRENSIAALHVLLKSEGKYNFPKIRQRMNDLSYKKRDDPHNLYHQWMMDFVSREGDATRNLHNYINGTIRAIGQEEEEENREIGR